jgi:molybdate transport system substrate-binding protein
VTAIEIKVLSTHAAFEVLSELGPRLERSTGHRLSIKYDPTNVIRRRIDDGAAFDVAIVTRPVIDDFAAQGRIVADSCVDIGRSGLGLAVRAGAPKPDIGTIDAFKRALLTAESVVRSKDGASGQYFATLLERLGIAEAMRGKVRLGASGRVAELVASGEVTMAVQQIAELLPVTGAQFVGPFPPGLQVYTVFAAGIGSAATNRGAAATLIDALTAPSAWALYKAKGLEPINR